MIEIQNLIFANIINSVNLTIDSCVLQGNP